MEALYVFFVLGLLFNQAVSRELRQRRQSPDEELDDRYGWSRPQQRPIPGSEFFPFQNPFQGQAPFPGFGQFPGQNQGQFPGQQPSQGQFPGQQPSQGQFPGQQPSQGQFPGQQPSQGQGQFPGQGQNQGQGQFPGQGQNQGQGQFPGGINQGQGQFPGQQQGQNQGQGQQTTTQNPNIQQCMRSCPVTSEYNPVCGSDNVTYSNPGRLTCAQQCGVNVQLARSLPCPPATTTVAPTR